MTIQDHDELSALLALVPVLRCPQGHTPADHNITVTWLTRCCRDICDPGDNETRDDPFVIVVADDYGDGDHRLSEYELFCNACGRPFPIPDGYTLEW